MSGLKTEYCVEIRVPKKNGKGRELNNYRIQVRPDGIAT